ncbi:hypothetical protein L7F22_029795 [Adiantum nelumboides]|nr:hypothetical protein [Adiantum nelumboides]
MHDRANVVCKSHASSIGEDFEPGQHGQEGIYVHSKEKEEKKVSSKASAKDDALYQLVLHMKEKSSRRAAMEERRQTSFEAMQSLSAEFLSTVISTSGFNTLWSLVFSSGFCQLLFYQVRPSGCNSLKKIKKHQRSFHQQSFHQYVLASLAVLPSAEFSSDYALYFLLELSSGKSTFEYICFMLAPAMKRQSTRMQRAVSLEDRVALSLHRLASGANVEVLADLYGCARSTNTQIVLDFCKAVCTSGLRNFYIRWPSSTHMLQMAEEFQKIRGIPNVIGAIDGSHIPIIARRENAVDYFNRKGFHSILLQLTVDSNCMVWDNDVGWAGSIHDSVNFSRSELGKRCENGMLNEFCLVEDCAYSARPYMLVPFKGSKDGLPDDKYYWNFI